MSKSLSMIDKKNKRNPIGKVLTSEVLEDLEPGRSYSFDDITNLNLLSVEKNISELNEKQVKYLEKSLEEFGFEESIYIVLDHNQNNPKPEVMRGKHRREASIRIRKKMDRLKVEHDNTEKERFDREMEEEEKARKDANDKGVRRAQVIPVPIMPYPGKSEFNVPCVVNVIKKGDRRDTNDIIKDVLSNSLKREASIWERSEGVKILKNVGLTTQRIADSIGVKDRKTAERLLRLSYLPNSIKEYAKANSIGITALNKHATRISTVYREWKSNVKDEWRKELGELGERSDKAKRDLEKLLLKRRHMLNERINEEEKVIMSSLRGAFLKESKKEKSKISSKESKYIKEVFSSINKEIKNLFNRKNNNVTYSDISNIIKNKLKV